MHRITDLILDAAILNRWVLALVKRVTDVQFGHQEVAA